MRAQEGEESEAHGKPLGLLPAPFTGPQGRRVPDTRESGSVPHEKQWPDPISCWLLSTPQSPALTGMFQH